ncbi:adaptin ear-binding coat-associated protein 1 NECAP-1 [Hyaloraphidium curvatum]|nr:adaptin ear-binding coat-associated protein 1 NECAP-1 [Hyaloraphidium curvatum]
MEQLHCLIREVFVHRLPPRKGAGQYKASDWDPQYLWKGRLRVASVGKECFINLEDADTGALFAQCPYEPGGTAVESVSDSSRYFVLRVVDRGGFYTKQSATIGIGFQERTDAFDFNVALQEFEKSVTTSPGAALG